ncbi:hypothetical protein H1C71_007591, partial [Ictidomys tridecemlineatus]
MAAPPGVPPQLPWGHLSGVDSTARLRPMPCWVPDPHVGKTQLAAGRQSPLERVCPCDRAQSLLCLTSSVLTATLREQDALRAHFTGEKTSLPAGASTWSPKT